VRRAEPVWGEGNAPQSWRVLVESGGAWKPWDGAPAETQAVRLEVEMAPRRGVELKKWSVE
jgi:hypothetical protein